MSEIMMKAPADVLDYDVDFGRWLPDGDVITEATAVVTGSSVSIHQIDASETVARIWLAGGAPDETGNVTVTVTTHQGRVKNTGFKIRIKEIQ